MKVPKQIQSTLRSREKVIYLQKANAILAGDKRKRIGSIAITNERIIYEQSGTFRSIILASLFGLLGEILRNSIQKSTVHEAELTDLSKVSFTKKGYKHFITEMFINESIFCTLHIADTESLRSALISSLTKAKIRFYNNYDAITI